jgi:hypothetical protein
VRRPIKSRPKHRSIRAAVSGAISHLPREFHYFFAQPASHLSALGADSILQVLPHLQSSQAALSASFLAQPAAQASDFSLLLQGVLQVSPQEQALPWAFSAAWLVRTAAKGSKTARVAMLRNDLVFMIMMRVRSPYPGKIEIPREFLIFQENTGVKAC